MYTWEEIEQHVNKCTACQLCRTRRRPVMGRGDHTGKLMLVAEAPGGQEDLEGMPFVGAAGRMLDELLTSVSIRREEIYITNILKCHPPGNRDPFEEEKEACMPYLKYETYLLKPKIIVCLGRVAAQRLIAPDYRITRRHGTWVERKGCFLTATYHPSALLRDPARAQEGKRDFQIIKEKLDCVMAQSAEEYAGTLTHSEISGV